MHLILGDALSVLQTMQSDSIDCCITSPPYFGLRDYGVQGQIGLEPTVDEYVQRLVTVFNEVKRVLKPDGTLWLNLGDSYSGGGNNRGNSSISKKQASNLGATGQCASHAKNIRNLLGIKTKDLIGIPWTVAFALRNAGWYLRQDIIWHKPNPMPESVRDRCTKAHEYIFLLTKNSKYYFNNDSIKEPCVSDHPSGNKKQLNSKGRFDKGGWTMSDERSVPSDGRNKRSVWTVTTKPFKGAHFATFPPDLIEPCILAGCPEGGVILDPFAGSGTVGMVALKHKRRFIGIELNPAYIEIAKKRIGAVCP